jgi:hypothetical protein
VQLLVGFGTPEAFGSFEHAGGSPAQSHLRVTPALMM